MKLSEYNKKRNFNKTKEPLGKVRKKSNNLKFVVQHHVARKDHYDLRLEWKGVYISWAVPKGPSYNPKDKRLAIRVEDHPISYGNFEGIIPKEEYGAGTVMLWDKGNYNLISYDKPNFDDGPIKFKLNGRKLKGEWSLVRFKDNNWLMIKEKDEYVNDLDINKLNKSIKSGKSMKDIADNKMDFDNIEITHPEKVIFKKGKITKEEIINYYKLVSERMMPFLDNRLISTVRCPDGLDGEHFFMKHLNTKSKNIGIKKIKDKEGISKEYFYIKNPNGLIEEVQMNSYEFHIWGSQQNNINKPDIMVFDFDPDKKISLEKVREGVKDLKKILDSYNLKSYLKTSGGKGYHVFVPLSSSWSKTEKISESIAQLMEYKWPDKYTTSIRKNARKGKIFIDYLRNKKSATSVCPYSLRLKKDATVSMPISWRMLNKVNPQDINIKNIKEWIKKKDPWGDFFNEQK